MVADPEAASAVAQLAVFDGHLLGGAFVDPGGDLGDDSLVGAVPPPSRPAQLVPAAPEGRDQVLAHRFAVDVEHERHPRKPLR
jgi:hypothetical protein